MKSFSLFFSLSLSIPPFSFQHKIVSCRHFAHRTKLVTKIHLIIFDRDCERGRRLSTMHSFIHSTAASIIMAKIVLRLPGVVRTDHIGSARARDACKWMKDRKASTQYRPHIFLWRFYRGFKWFSLQHAFCHAARYSTATTAKVLGGEKQKKKNAGLIRQVDFGAAQCATSAVSRLHGVSLRRTDRTHCFDANFVVVVAAALHQTMSPRCWLYSVSIVFKRWTYASSALMRKIY